MDACAEFKKKNKKNRNKKKSVGISRNIPMVGKNKETVKRSLNSETTKKEKRVQREKSAQREKSPQMSQALNYAWSRTTFRPLLCRVLAGELERAALFSNAKTFLSS